MLKPLSAEQLQAFYHRDFVEDQVRDFLELAGSPQRPGQLLVDVGGGCGFFAKALQERAAWRVRVLDRDPASIDSCLQQGIQARLADALAPTIEGDEDLVGFNLILHHLVGGTAEQTRRMQVQALSAWAGGGRRFFVNEYIYESFLFQPLSAWLIWKVTRSPLLSCLGRWIAMFLPTLRANTFGVGVRFRTAGDWITLFQEAGLEVVGSRRGWDEGVSLPRRLLMIRSCRRDSFLLQGAGTGLRNRP